MGSFSLPHILILAIVAILLLGGGRFSSMMGDVAKGVKNFKKGMSEDDGDDDLVRRPKPRIEAQSAAEPALKKTDKDRKIMTHRVAIFERAKCIFGKNVDSWGKIICTRFEYKITEKNSNPGINNAG